MFIKGIILPIVWLFIWAQVNCFVINPQQSAQPMLLLVSFDGFRWDYLNMYNLTNFNYLKNLGSHADYIINSFSTVTFPNHWTIVTGLYEESHGILQNQMYDPLLNKTFYYKSPETQTIEWYGQNKLAEPIWVTNQKAGEGRKSAAEWIGANVIFQEQNITYIPYNKSKSYKQLIDQFIQLFTQENEPINFGALYFDEPDHVGHLYGPYSVQMKEKLEELDQELGYMIEQLRVHNLFDRLNLIITSDHGMDTISNKTAIFLDNYIDTNLFKAYGTRACYNLFLNESDIDYVYETLKSVPDIDVYLKKDIPDRFNYKHNSRIGDILLVTRIGHALYINKEAVNWTVNNGDHGYDNAASSMHPIFIAHGPAFKKSYKTKVFNNVDIYPLMCSILGVAPAVNNGSMYNVEQMLVSSQQKLMIFFIIIFLTPIFTASATGILLCLSTRDSSFKKYKNSIVIYKDPLLAVESKIGHLLNHAKQEKKQNYFSKTDWKRRSV